MSSVNYKKICFDTDRAAGMAAWVNLVYFAEIFWLQLHLSAMMPLIPALLLSFLLMMVLVTMSVLVHVRRPQGIVMLLFWADLHLILGIPWLITRLWNVSQLEPMTLAFVCLRGLMTCYEILVIVLFTEHKKADVLHGQG